MVALTVSTSPVRHRTVTSVSATLIARGLGAARADRVLFSGLDLVVSADDVVGLVGANGAGKTTLMRLLAGLDEATEGTVVTAPRTATVGYLPQESDRRSGETAGAYVMRRTGVGPALEAMDDAAQALTDGQPGADDAYSSALDRWLALGGADLDERVPQLAHELGLDVETTRPTTALSGGQSARLGLASLLLSRYDVLLLDEPTNNLDLDGLDRLESFVKGLRSPAVIVSHDREFLARTVTRVVEIDPVQQSVAVFGGGYDSFLEEREIARRQARQQYDDYAETMSSLKERARTQRAWSDKGVAREKRNPRDNDKAARKARADQTEKQAAKARQTERLIERLDVVDEPRKKWQLQMSIADAQRSGDVVAVLRGAVVERGSFRLGPVDLQIDRGDRVAIQGANGSGKSTLLAALLGRIAVTEGSASLGSGVAVGEVDQARGTFLAETRLLRAFGDQVPDWPEADVRTLLAKFGLGADQVLRPASTLSPGERTRAALALLQARGVNVLVLDEPTNHLDLPAIEQVEAALDSYDGTLLLVSHDRRLLDAVHVERRILVANGRVAE